MSVLTLTGGQYGSEGKGVIAAHLAPRVDVAVRTGGPNAGHSLIHEGRVWKMRSVPCAWINPRTALVIGAAAVIDPEVLIHEVLELESLGYDIRSRLLIDQHATAIVATDREAERKNAPGGPGALTDTIGSTGEGVGAARIRRIRRRPEEWVPIQEALGPSFRYVDTTLTVNVAIMQGQRVLLEGTQGFGLSLSHGHWPYVTSNNCTHSSLMADAGIGAYPSANLLVFRAYPIRVGGNSGPMAGELTWEEMRMITGNPDLIEHTTVTGKVRRIAQFDWSLAARAVLLNNPTSLALTFADYIDPAVEGAQYWEQLTSPVRSFIDQLESKLGVPVEHVGTGGPVWAVVTRPTGDSGHPGSR